MRILMLLFIFGVCYVSLPITSTVDAVDASAAAPASVDQPTVPLEEQLTFTAAPPSSGEAAELVLFGAAAHLAKTKPAAVSTVVELAKEELVDDDDADSDDADSDASENAEEKSTDEKEATEEQPAATAKESDTETTDKNDDDDSKASTDDKAPAETKVEAKEEAAKEESAKKKERKTHTVKPKRLKVDVSLDGAFVADIMTEIALRPDVWSQYEIVEIVKHGAKVHTGQTLIKFDAEKLNETIAELELDQRISELAIRKVEEALPREEKTLEMDANAAERADKYAKADYERYHEIERPMILKSVEYSLKYAQFNVDYQQDELDQLEKMYEADDLTEETEEVVLKRTRNQLEFAKFNLKSTKLNADELLEVRLPRNDIRIKESLDRAELNLARAKTAQAVDLNKARYELEKAKEARRQSLDRHVKLLADRDLMEITAPVDGTVYYGQCTNGSWSDLASMLRKLEPHNNVSAGTVMMTILETRPLHVLAVVDEDKRPGLSAGQATKLTPPGDDADSIDAKLKDISTVPIASGKFRVEFDLTGSDLPEWIVPGVSCKLKVTTYDKDDALTVPKKAIQTDEEDEDQKYVWIVDADDAEAEAERRNITTGKTSGDDVEVVKGLKEGDVVSLEDESKKDEENDS